MNGLRDNIDCEQKCEIPKGISLSRIPSPRHAWKDILRCPDCGDCFLVTKDENYTPTKTEHDDARGSEG